MLRTTPLLLAAAIHVCAAAPCSANALFIHDKPILDLIGSVEGPDGYDDVTLASPIRPPKPPTQMTIEEVLAFQNRIASLGANSTAMGRYQFIRGTLQEMVDKLGIDRDVIFDQRTQDYLARRMLYSCDFYDPAQEDLDVANCLARKWAALPVVTGPKKGVSYYQGRAGNRALTTVQRILAVVGRRFSEPTPASVLALR